MNIAMCYDEPSFAEKMESTIQEICTSIGLDVHIHAYSNSNDLLNSMRYSFDAVFLDLDMPNMSSIDVACQIRNNDSKTHIIFVTSRNDLASKCFQSKVLSFISKNHIDEELKEVIETLKHEIDMINIVYRVLSNNKLVSYPINNILYFESYKHYIDIHLLDRIDTIRKNIKEVEQDLSNSGFIRTHVGYIVNYKYISSIEKSQVILFNPLSDNTTINVPISRNKYKSVQERYMYFSMRD